MRMPNMCPFEKIENLLNNFRIFFFKNFRIAPLFFFCLIYIIKSDVCLRTLECPANYSSSFDAMGYPRVPMASLWPNGGNKPNWRKIWAKKIFFFKKILYVIPSALVSFLPYYCHSIRITVIPSGSLSFIPDYCHSFHIGVIPSKYCYSFRITVIPSGSLSFIPDYCHSFHIGVIPSKYCYSFQIIQRITNTN